MLTKEDFNVPKRSHRIMMVAGAVACFASGFLPEQWFALNEIGFGAALICVVLIFISYILDGEK
ncbi:MAG: hypothetical protein AAGG50_15260 [Bacteroidota bacterium]